MENNQTQQNRDHEYSPSCADFSIPADMRIYTDEELTNISDLGDILQGIHKRLISEGLSIDELRKNLR